MWRRPAGDGERGGPMDEQQAKPDSDGRTPPAARPPASSAGPKNDQGYELPPPPAPGALWPRPPGPDAARPTSSGTTPPARASASAPVSAAPVSAAPAS